jgi:hypothetical protein
MPISPIDVSRLTLNLAQWRGQALSSLFDPVAPAWSSVPVGGAAGDSSPFDSLSNSMLASALPGGAGIASPDSTNFSSVLDQFSAALDAKSLPTPTKPTGLDASQAFSQPGQNMVTVLNRVEVSFKAQYAELDQLKSTLTQEQDAAKALSTVGTQTSNADIAAALDNFVASYNAGVTRFAPDVAAGGILEGSQEAARARFATKRDIDNILTGSEVGVEGGLAALGISTDPKTGLASIDHAQLEAALAKNKGIDLVAINDFATTFAATVSTLTAPDHAQVRQMANLDHAVQWIGSNKDAVQKEFGPGAAATPDDAFAKAATRYDEIAKLIAPS